MFGLFKKSANNDIAHSLYVGVVNQARVPAFYNDCGVPDTPDGRFDMILLHAYLLFHRMKDDLGETSEIAQAVFDLMFADMDQNLREMGLGDIGVSYRIKGMTKALNGRITVYDESLLADDNSRLEAALRRNLYRKSAPADEQVAALADYVRCEIDNLSHQPTAMITQGSVTFGPAPLPEADIKGKHP